MLLTLATSSWTLDAGARMSPPAAAASSHSTAASPHSILDLQRAERWCTEAGLSEAQLRSVYGHLFRRGGAFTPAALHEAGLSATSATALCDAFDGVTSRVLERVPSEGGMKLVVELPSGQHVEMALILHDHKSSCGKRCTCLLYTSDAADE